MNSKDLSVYLKIIKQSIDDFDDPEQARPAVEAITPAAEQGNSRHNICLASITIDSTVEIPPAFCLGWRERQVPTI